MKNYVSYMIQDEKAHTFHSEIVETKNPGYSYSMDPQVPDVFEWAEKKQSELPPNQKLVILNIFKM